MSYYPPITIAAAIQKIDYKQYLLPAIQREFVWECEKIELLFDSLMLNYPIGSLLMWKVSGRNIKNHRYYSILQHYRQKYKSHSDEVNTSTLSDFEAVLDGQQRLTAIYIGLKGTYAYKRPRVVMKDNEHALPTRKLYLNLSGLISQDDTEDEVPDDGRLYNFKFLSKDDIENDKTNIWFEVGKILSLQGVFQLNNYIKKNNWMDNEFICKTLSLLHEIIHIRPVIHYYLEKEDAYDKALNIFIRINRQGEPLEYSDLVMSTTIAGWKKRKAREEINNLIDEVWNSYGISINKDTVLRSYLMLFNDDIRFRASNFTLKKAIEFENNWDHIREAIITAFELISNFGYVERTMTSKNAALPIVHYLFASGKVKGFCSKVAYKADRDVVRRWLHAVLLHGIFGGQADNVLKIIRDTISKEIKKECKSFPASAIAKRLSKTTRKSITVDDEFIENLLYTEYGDRYSFPILALLYPNLDYKNGDFHEDHIHPISSFRPNNLKKIGIDFSKKNADYYTDKGIYNGIVNLQLLDGNMNKSKKASDLAKWVMGNEVDLKKQLIPNVLEFGDFIKFVDRRWNILQEKLRKELTF